MNKQELLEAIAPYFPHNVKCLHFDDERGINQVCTIEELNKDEATLLSNEYEYFVNIDDVNLILRPLSDLTKPCLEGGKVPIVELAKIESLWEPISFDTMEDLKGELRGVCAKDSFNNQWLMFDFKEGFSMWHKPHHNQDHTLTLLDNQLELFKFLYRHHFDLHSLIEKGYAITLLGNSIDAPELLELCTSK